MKTFTFVTATVLAGALFILSGCRTAISPNNVVVTVNGDPISENQIIKEADKRINANIARDRKRGMMFEESARPAMREAMREDVIQTLTERLLIAQQLKRDNVEITDAEVDAYLLEKAKQFGETTEQAEENIRGQGKTIDEVKERIRWHTLGIEKLYSIHTDNKQVLTEAEALKIYTEYPREFDREEKRRVSHILIRANPDDAEAAKKVAREKADELLAKIRSGEDFASLARTCSEDELSRDEGGDRGYSGRGIIMSPTDDPFGNVAFAMKNIGDISDVVETRDGFHIIKLTDVKPAGRLSFDEAKVMLIGDFRYHEIRRFWEQFGGDLQAKSKIELSPREIARRTEMEKRQQLVNAQIEADIARQQREDAIEAGSK